MKVVYHISNLIAIGMKKILFIHAVSVMVFFAVWGAVFAQDTLPPDPDLRLQMQKRMRVQQETAGSQQEERQAGAQARTEERHTEARKRFEERRAGMLQRQEESRKHMETRHEELRQRWEDHKAQLSERRKQNIKNHVERIIQRMKQAVERLEDMANKIEGRLSRLQEEGADVAPLQLLLKEARSAISRANASLDTAAVELRAAPDANNSADALGKARALLENVKITLKEAHAALVEIVVEMKKGQLIPRANESDRTGESDGTE